MVRGALAGGFENALRNSLISPEKTDAVSVVRNYSRPWLYGVIYYKLGLIMY